LRGIIGIRAISQQSLADALYARCQTMGQDTLSVSIGCSHTPHQREIGGQCAVSLHGCGLLHKAPRYVSCPNSERAVGFFMRTV
jgi:hypothetical protein